MVQVLNHRQLEQINNMRQKTGMPIMLLYSANKIMGRAPVGTDTAALIVWTVADTDLPPPGSLLPNLQTLNPSKGDPNSPAFALECLGTNFTTFSVIIINGVIATTIARNTTKLTTVVQKFMFPVQPQDVPVIVRSEFGDSSPLLLSFKAN